MLFKIIGSTSGSLRGRTVGLFEDAITELQGLFAFSFKTVVCLLKAFLLKKDREAV
ncbi:hypothetical protein AB1L42_13165 [Thalassoglobus sp. JC818]|uniref:hypothetical protein n=1 Tax=Thalassoglobus sp. JC818 TaxID=3232136 RepID=UPI00345740F7